MTSKNENRSLFLYTALIFLAAIAIILISFFSQVNLEKYGSEDSSPNTISEKTAQLSEENMMLLEMTRNLNEHNTQLLDENKKLSGKVSGLEKELNEIDELYKAFDLLNKGDNEKAKAVLDTLANAEFEGNQLEFYEYLQNELN